MHGTDFFTTEVEDEVLVEPDYETDRNKPMPNPIHGAIQASVVFYLKAKYRSHYNISSEVSLNLTPGATPDVCVFGKKELDWRTVKAKEDEMPITTIEILSPSQSLDSMAQKVFNQYFPAGVQSAWIVAPPPFRAIYLFTPDGKRLHFDTGIITDPVTSIQIAVDEVFEGIR